MPTKTTPAPITDTDYDAIEAAVMETARGRWFLAEFATRNRNADTKLVLEAIQRLQRSVLGGETASVLPAPSTHEIPASLAEMERTVERTKRELLGMEAARLRDGDLGGELHAIVDSTAQAIGEILAHSERIQDIALTMREQGRDASVCDQLDGLATFIYTACAFQDLTGQRIAKVIAALRLQEERIQSLVRVWQIDITAPADRIHSTPLLNGPAKGGEGLLQEDVDELLAIDQHHDIFWEGDDAKKLSPKRSQYDLDDIEVIDAHGKPAPAAPAQPEKKSIPSAKRAITREDIEAMPVHERLALFS